MEKLPGVQLIINEDDFDLDDDTIEEAGKDKLTRQMVEELFTIREMAEDMEDDGDIDFEGNPADRKYYIHFNSAPVEVLGEDGKVIGDSRGEDDDFRGRQDDSHRRIRRVPGAGRVPRNRLQAGHRAGHRVRRASRAPGQRERRRPHHHGGLRRGRAGA